MELGGVCSTHVLMAEEGGDLLHRQVNRRRCSAVVSAFL
jgi:hypothetical protein